MCWRPPVALDFALMGRRGADLTRDQVVQIVTLHNEGLGSMQISQRLDMSRRTVQLWIKKYLDSGSDAIPTPKGRPGPKKKIDIKLSRRIRRLLEKDPTLTVRKLKETLPNDLADVSVRCLSDHVSKELKYRSVKAKVKPLITIKNQRDRLAWCKAHRGWSLAQWRGVLWSDESTFTVSAGNRSARVRRAPGPSPHLPKYSSESC